jgi:hypothetical protein
MSDEVSISPSYNNNIMNNNNNNNINNNNKLTPNPKVPSAGSRRGREIRLNKN